MRAEEIVKVLSAVGIDFIEDGAKSRVIYLYADDLLADGITPLSAYRAIKVTFEYTDTPTFDES